MADFCKQCSENTFGEDFCDLAGITTNVNTRHKEYASVICEGCGPTLVDHTGQCVNPECLHHHGKETKHD